MANNQPLTLQPQQEAVVRILEAHALIDELLDAAIAAEESDEIKRSHSTLELAFQLYRQRARAKGLSPCVPGLRKAARQILSTRLAPPGADEHVSVADVALQLRIAMALERDRLPACPAPQLRQRPALKAQLDQDPLGLLVAAQRMLTPPMSRVSF